MVDVVRPSDRGVLVDLLVVPNASTSEVVGLHGDRVKVRVTAPPERRKANAAVVALVCSTFGVRSAEIVAGRTTRFKTVELIGADAAAVVRWVTRG
jgi:uncharacterized protein (TIGR00251 family)